MENSHSTAKKHGWFGRSAVVVGIVIVLNLFFNYAISLVYKEPSYEAYMPTSQVVEPITNKADCLAAGGQWTDPDPRYVQPVTDPATGMKTAPAYGSCNPNYTAQKNLDAAEKAYSRNVFIILVVLGVLSLAVGAFLSSAVLATAFSWGGVLSLFIASVRYWNRASDIVHVALLALALGALIWVAVRKIEKK